MNLAHHWFNDDDVYNRAAIRQGLASKSESGFFVTGERRRRVSLYEWPHQRD